MNHTSFKNVSIGDIVTEDFRAAEIFKNAGIDFCCGGKKSLDEACQEKGIATGNLTAELLKLLDSPVVVSQDFKNWDLGFLCDYIMNTHHKYVLKSLPDLVMYTQKIASVHGEHHPELIEIAGIIAMVNAELLQHLKNEEEVLFPAIKAVLATGSMEAKPIIIAEIARMNDEHEVAGGALDTIQVITNGYTVPEDGCNSYRVAFKLLHEFEEDLHTHVHLENNILYLKALGLAKS